MKFAVYPATIVAFDVTERTVTVKLGELCSMTKMGIAIGDPAELRPNPGQKVPCGFCGSADGGFPGDHGPECPCNPNRPREEDGR